MLRGTFFKKTDRSSVQLLRAILSSNVAFAIDFGLLVLLTEVFGVHYLISNVIGFMSGTTFLYVLSIKWVFSRRKVESRHAEYWIFILIGGAGVGLNELLIWTFTEHAHIYYLISKMLAGTTVFFFNFFMRKYVLFR
jgi:putative flippase GtrA